MATTLPNALDGVWKGEREGEDGVTCAGEGVHDMVT